MIDIKQGDCLELMKEIPDESVNLILCDLPYGVLNKKNPNAQWDTIIPLDKLWEQYERIIKDNGAIVLFASGMFTAQLMMSNKSLWKYNLIWKKGNRSSGFLNAKKQPLRNHEDIVVFYKNQPTYNPQMTLGQLVHKKGNGYHKQTQNCYGEMKEVASQQTNEKYPISVIDVPKEHPQEYHPTQKPVELLKYLISTYTNEGDLVLDNCMGSGSTGVACKKLKRGFIGYELDEHYFNIAQSRIEKGYYDVKEETSTKKPKKLF